MRIFLISIIVLLLMLPSFSQDHKAGSLLEVVENKNIDRSLAYYLLYKKYKKTNRDSAKSLYLDASYREALKYDNDSVLGVTLNDLGSYYLKVNNSDTAEQLLTRALKVRMEIDDSLGVSKVYNNFGNLYFNQSLYRKAVTSFQKALEYKLLLGQAKGAGISYNAIGRTYNKWGKNKLAIEFYQKALVKFEEAEFKTGLSISYNNIGLIYMNLSKEKDTVFMNKAFAYYEKSLEINTEIDNLWDIANNQSNMANIFAAKAEQYRSLTDSSDNQADIVRYAKIRDEYFDKAIFYAEKSAVSRTILKDDKGLAGTYIVMGNILINKAGIDDSQKALEYLFKALELNMDIGDQYQTAVCNTYIAMAYNNIKDYSSTLLYLDKAKKTALDIGLKFELSSIYRIYSEAYDSLGNYKKSLRSYQNFHAYYDLISSKETKEIIADMQTKYETGQKEAALEIANKENEAQQLKSKQQMLIIYGFIGVFVIVIIFSVVVYRQFKQIQKSNQVLSKQKAQIEEANEELYQSNEEISAQRDEIQFQKDQIEKIHKEVSDSIHYAERIQRAILPKVDDIDQKITDRFTLFKPKDVVSGDFHWSKHLEKNNLFVATAADCTGHGVPGAFMSMLGVAFLNEIVSKTNVTNTGEVLDNLRQSVMTSLHQTGADGEAQDGMDIAFVAYNYVTKSVQFSGANNPLYIIRPKEKSAIDVAEKIVEGNTHTLYEIKGDKMPIGIYKKTLTDFTSIEVQLEDGDQMYMFSDGYADQFGGPKGKKLKYKPFKGLLLDNATKPMSVQSQILDNYFEDWRGNLEQVDDVIVMGIKV